ncbi:MAG: hypothetical protein JNL88_03745 [Bacteroidia bacterium]|nr:hypothetical protein [Bacteroidia bacterium]
MIVAFDSIPEEARVWVFQSDRFLTTAEESGLSRATGAFLESWTAHAADLKSAFRIIDHVFLVIAVDERNTGASGCSLDKLHQFVKQAGSQLNIDFLNRLRVTYLRGDDALNSVSLTELETLMSHGEVMAETKVYDVTVQTVAELKTSFVRELKNTWLNRYRLA